MVKNKSDYSDIFDRLFDWLSEAVKQDVINMMDIVEKARAYVQAAESLSAAEIKTMENYLLRDFTTFSKQWKSDARKSIWLVSLEGRLWQQLASLSDANKIELYEMEMDIAHQGIYRVGELVSVGVLTCNQCGQQHQVDFVEEILPCMQCNARTFTRSSVY